MITAHRWISLAALAASAILTASCHDTRIEAPSLSDASVAIVASLSAASGGTRTAYDKVNHMIVRFTVGSDVRLERDVPFNPNATQTSLRVSVPLRAPTEVVTTTIELQRGDTALFRGTSTPTLSAHDATPVAVTLEPIVAGVSCTSAPLQVTQYGRAGTLVGVPIFATGDTISSTPVTWSASGAVVNVAADGQLIALQDGTATATCSASGFSATRTIQVAATPRSIQVEPASASIPAGSTVTFTATVLDAQGNRITSPQTVVWSSSNTGVATVSATGDVTPVTGGSARVVAAIGQVTGSAPITTVFPNAQGVTGNVTVAATNISGTSATLLGSVPPTPSGSASNTEAWFAFGTNNPPSGQSSTPHQTLPTGTADLPITAVITNLIPGATYYYQVVTQNGSVTKSGPVLNFRAPALPTATTTGLNAAYTRGYALDGSATPNGSATVAWFEYGTSATLDASSQTVKQPVGARSSPVALTLALTGLQPATTYYARLVASNAGGTSAGNIVTFTTAAAAP